MNRYVVVGDHPGVAVEGRTFTDEGDAQALADRLNAGAPPGRRYAVRILGRVAGKVASGPTSGDAT